jgi:hypothetical protein
MSHYLEEVWDDILSRRPARIRRRFDLLDAASQQEVLQHLTRITTEDGWQEPQIISAQTALKTLRDKDMPSNG